MEGVGPVRGKESGEVRRSLHHGKGGTYGVYVSASVDMNNHAPRWLT